MAVYPGMKAFRKHLLLLALLLPIISTIGALVGHAYYQISKASTLVLFILLVIFIVVNLKQFFLKNRRMGFLLLAVYCFFTILVLHKYQTVFIGGQDPAYYTAFGKILSEGLGSPFSSESFEYNATGDPQSLWSTFTKNGLTEIQFYPMLPSILAGLDTLAGEFSYPVIGIFSGLLISSFLLRVYTKNSPIQLILVSCLWLFMPATIWFSRTPTSEILSVVLVALSIALHTFKSSSFEKYLQIYLISLGLMLIRPNPLYILMLLIFNSGYDKGRDLFSNIMIIFKTIFLPIVLGVLSGLAIYLKFLPNFSEIVLFYIYQPLVKPTLILLACVTLFAVFWYGLSNFRSRRYLKFIPKRFRTLDLFLLNQNLLIAVMVLILISTSIVLFRSQWGVYQASQFGQSLDLLSRFAKTPLVFIFTSFFFSVLLFRVNNHLNQTKLLVALLLFLCFAVIRNPAIPITYFYERYWWSEIGLLILFLLPSSIERLSKLSSINYLLVLSIACSLIMFGRIIVLETEGGVSTKEGFEGIVYNIRAQENATLYFNDDEYGSWLSQVVVPLRYYYGFRVTKRSELPEDLSFEGNLILISSQICKHSELLSVNLEVQRLSKFASGTFGTWRKDAIPVNLCLKG